MLARLPQLGRIAHLRGRGATIPRALQHSKFDRPLYYDEPPALPNRAREHSSTSTSTTSADTSFRSQQHLQQQRHSGKRRSTVEEIMLDGARVVSAAHALFNSIIRAGDVVVDATCGNGHDTLFLAERVGAKGIVYGFDVQELAIKATRERITSSLDPSSTPDVRLICGCHSTMQEHVGSNRARLVVFNLGYLPAGDKSITTLASSTLYAVESALEVVGAGGFISIMCYVGHQGGIDEYEAIKNLVSKLSPHFWVSSEARLLNRKLSPVWIQIWRR